jgi:dihydropteroate synthase
VESLAGTIALNMLALCHSASILRVHDIKQCAETIKLFNVLCSF